MAGQTDPRTVLGAFADDGLISTCGDRFRVRREVMGPHYELRHVGDRWFLNGVEREDMLAVPVIGHTAEAALREFVGEPRPADAGHIDWQPQIDRENALDHAQQAVDWAAEFPDDALHAAHARGLVRHAMALDEEAELEACWPDRVHAEYLDDDQDIDEP